MPGEKSLPIGVVPDTFQYVSVTLSHDEVEYAKSAYLFFCEEDTVVDSAFLSFTPVDGSDDATFTLQSVPSGLLKTAGVTPVGPEGSGTVISDSIKTGTTADASVAFTITETANIVPAGNRIAVKVANTSNAEGAMITLRIRTRLR